MINSTRTITTLAARTINTKYTGQQELSNRGQCLD
ncbi:hypothetical protein Ptr902_03160 [Pyrenophora tritici-repentis]|uniref:Uncharacterized protein n=1 Tax=Pyrenophora tritici-repentis TaxID=45151 RepID=A0A834RW01_9PLEO|nr:hypothetical protein PtrM4_107640 [Pyrenophora tritici-repentis]KAI2484220.1 hypothetical protein Ptr902_03160 [Pyrenophora tritici-repentis]